MYEGRFVGCRVLRVQSGPTTKEGEYGQTGLRLQHLRVRPPGSSHEGDDHRDECFARAGNRRVPAETPWLQPVTGQNRGHQTVEPVGAWSESLTCFWLKREVAALDIGSCIRGTDARV